jgi:threonine dehydratase
MTLDSAFVPQFGRKTGLERVTLIDQTAGTPSFEGVVRASARLKRRTGMTPLVKSELLSKAFDAEVWLKVETATAIASFKLRGALNALLATQEMSSLRRAVTSSTGNHGQAVAFAAQTLGVPADIFLPDNPNPTKRDMIAAFGAKIHVGGYDIDDAKRRARDFCKKMDGTFVDDGEDVHVIEGAGTIGLEVGSDLAQIDWLFAPMGSGSLASGTAAGLKGLQPRARVVAVQSEGSPAMVESFRARNSIERPVDTIADCIVCRVPATTALNALLRYVDDAILVNDATLLSAVHTLISDAHVLAETGAAAALAGAWQRRAELKGKRIVVLVTGANIPTDHLRRALAAPALSATH